jgi:hypothetical protein
MTINGGGGQTLLQLHPRKHKKEEMSHSVRHDRKKQEQRRFLTTFGMTGKTKNKRIPHCARNKLRDKDKIALV